MGTRTVEKDILGTSYKLKTFGARQGSETLIVLTRFLGPTFAHIAGDLEMAAEDTLAKALGSFAQTAKPADFHLVVDAFAAQCLVPMMVPKTNAGPQKMDLALNWDDHFAGELGTLLVWMAWCIRENYADFFGGKAAMLAANVLGIDLVPRSESPQG